MFADVSFPIASYRIFTYRVPDSFSAALRVGMRVMAPLGKRKNVTGVIVEVKDKTEYSGEIHELSGVIDEKPAVDENLWRLLKWMCDYYVTPLGRVIRTAIPFQLSQVYQPREIISLEALPNSSVDLIHLQRTAKKQFNILTHLIEKSTSVPLRDLNELFGDCYTACKALEKKQLVKIIRHPQEPSPIQTIFPQIEKEVAFTNEQQRIIEKIANAMEEGTFQPFLLHGVTGSGKTEVYLQLAKKAVERGKKVIILLPEISLTPQIAGRFYSVFQDRIAIWHSRLTPAERKWMWRKMNDCEYSIVIGARSAIFAPFKNVGLIVVDEEQEASFKQEDPAPRYHARDVALMRGKLSHAVTLLAAATPSLESYYNAIVANKIGYLQLTERYGDARFPSVQLVNMAEERKNTTNKTTVLSTVLIEKISDRLQKGEQVILLQNRRGYSPVVMCWDCGRSVMCKHCNVTMTFHKIGNILRCHYCGFEKGVTIQCEFCQSPNVLIQGIGTQRVEEELNFHFPAARIARLDMDTARKVRNMSSLLSDFETKNIDILLGTQMIAKGLDFENVTLVGVINAGAGLYLPDFRAGERLFQLIYQVAGRAGRGKKAGEAVIQTYAVDELPVQYASRLDLKTYYNIALAERKELHFAPFSWMVRLLFSGKQLENVEKRADAVHTILKKGAKGFIISPPLPCPLEKLRGKYRYQIVIKSSKNSDVNGSRLHGFLKKFIDKGFFDKKAIGVSILVDVDPVSLL